MNLPEIKVSQDLPIAPYESEIIDKFEQSSNMIIIGETGSGKTTQIPLMLLKSLEKYQLLERGKIAVTEPRRLAATSVAEYTAKNLGNALGESVGYKIRFDQNYTDNSVLIFMTDGMLIREAQSDPLLSQYAVIMIDEAHERNINSDFLIGLCVDIQKKRRKKQLLPLKILVTSATLEKDKFIDFFNTLENESLAVIEVPGRLYPITTHLETHPVYEYEYRAAQIVGEIVRKKESGDILIFMPGKYEITKTKENISLLKNFESMNLEMITIHADLPMDEQNKIFKKSEKRKVVIATNIAETSLTVPGIVYVIDSGLIKQMEFDPHTGINTLVTTNHSKKGLEQRKGRSGRIQPGIYYGLYTEESFRERPEFQKAEILRNSLSQIILIMKKIGVKDIEHFKFVDKPDLNYLDKAILELKLYGALDEEENLTEKGLTMANLPIVPKLSNLIIEADKNGCIDAICTIAAFLELNPVIKPLFFDEILKNLIESQKAQTGSDIISNYEEMENEAEQIYLHYKSTIQRFEHFGSDFLTLLNIYHKWIKADKSEKWCDDNYLSYETLIEADNIKSELLEIAEENNYKPWDHSNHDIAKRVEKTIIKAFRHNLLIKLQKGGYRNIKTQDSDIRIHNSSVFANLKPPYVIAYEVIQISEINAEPKLSAKFVHSIDEGLFKQNFPEAFKKFRFKSQGYNNRRRWKFNSHQGRKNRHSRRKGRR